MVDFVLEHGLFWTAHTTLPEWAGFQSRYGPYGARDTLAPSDGRVQISFAPEGRGPEPLTAAERVLIDVFLDNHTEQAAALLNRLVVEYPALRARYLADIGDDDASTALPKVENPAGFRDVIGLHHIHVHQIERAGQPYVGYEFGCDWEDEHGLGVLMHGTRVVEIGGGDTAFTKWIADRDSEAIA